ncbi:hypothetical protein FB567DRAFT_528998 [Paraphoma chrysanthemicola]|uniref:Uncharacterized protein n=1 Tax=Paraphoma chrysanthemicola TaxID=798071 RepID=A0A8K0VWU6_9PLEO|nr:hypothetical protein FB567DRAFT_528998 [Paraphoma chrysanthemicola]
MSEVHVAHTVGKTRAAEVTGVSFKIYDSTAGRNADEPGTASNKAIIGAIIGTVCFIVLAVLFCAVWRKRFKYGSKGRRSTAEKGLHQENERRRTAGRSTNDAIDDAYRARLERNQRTREAQKTAARQASTADDQGPVTAKRRTEAKSASTLGSIDSSALAQAQGWDAPFAADTFQSHQPPPSLTSMPDVLHPPPIIIEPPTPARHGSQRADVRCVSPLRETFGLIREPGMRTVGCDVSPPDSPKESGGDRWAR